MKNICYRNATEIKLFQIVGINFADAREPNVDSGIRAQRVRDFGEGFDDASSDDTCADYSNS
jgi:hypothetical protein